MTLAVLQKAIQSYGQQKALAHDLGISPSFISDVYRGNRVASGKVLTKLGLEVVVTRTVTYQWKEDGE